MPDNLVPLPLIYSTLVISAIGVFGNLTIVLITIKNKTLHSRCCLLIGLLASFDFIVCVYLVHLRIMMVFEVYLLPNSSCFYLSVHGIFAMNMQSGLGLTIGIDRLLNVSFPMKYPQIPRWFYAIMLLICVTQAGIVTGLGWLLITDDRISGACLPVTALRGPSLTLWFVSNFTIAVSVVIVYGYAYVRCQYLTAKNLYSKTMEAVNRLLKSLTIILSLYFCTWFSAITAMFIAYILNLDYETTTKVTQGAGLFVVCNSSFHVFVYFCRTAEYRKAICRLYGISPSETETHSKAFSLHSNPRKSLVVV